MVGFITARLTTLAESDSADRGLLGLAGRCLDSQHAVYILTLGTLPALRHQVSCPPGRYSLHLNDYRPCATRSAALLVITTYTLMLTGLV